LVEIFKALCVSAVICEYDTVRSFVVSLRYCSESFLAGGVPHLQFDYFVVNLDFLALKVYSNCGLVLPGEFVFRKFYHERGFADRLIPNNDDAEKVVVGGFL